MNLTDAQVEQFSEKWREVFFYFIPKDRNFENDMFTILNHLPDNLDFDLLSEHVTGQSLQKSFIQS